MAITSIYLGAYTMDGKARREIIQQLFPDYHDWTDQNFWIVFAGQEVNIESGTIQSWDEDMIHIVVN